MGEVFAGRYELVDPIGRGGAGAVWRAWDHRRRRYVAAKVLQQSDAHTLLRFVREQALRIDHPHVLAPASWAADDDKVLFTMDLVKGGSLAHVIGDYGPLAPKFVCTLLDQLLAGLTAVHEEGVVHRDIKPANVLLEATGTGRPHLRLSDFGIAMRKGEPRLTETDYVVGTPGYFAPEQMLGEEPDFPGDLFAVGLVGLYLLEGAKPDSKALIQHFAAHGTPDAPQGIPEPLWQVLATLLQPDPDARFRTASGARKALHAAAELLPEPGPDDEIIEVFDQLGPLPPGFGPEGPLKKRPAAPPAAGPDADHHPKPPPPPSVPPPPPTTPPPAPARDDDFRLAPPTGTNSGPSAPQPTATPTPTPTPTPVPPAPVAPPQPPTPPPTPLPHAEPPTPPTVAQDEPGLRFPADGHTYPLTRPYPAQPVPAVQQPAQAVESIQGAPRPHRRKRRPGPPVKVAVPVLLLALLSYAVGFWALSRL
ncbi:serine/threonine-protein kinase [Streptomyces sp. Da 82-17]|uniref:serine/threonine-protein kinase n=1 Tax=Streptomyces sp. Da 82-17 TaxID=3377116 RepID=UPI0038D50C13